MLDFQRGRVLLRYVQGQTPFEEIEIISKGSRKVFFKLADIDEYIKKDNFKGVLILSTTKGLITHSQALRLKLGGEAICLIK